MGIGVIPGEISLEKTVLPLGPFGNSLVNTVDTAVRYAVHLMNLGGDVLANAETTPGTYTVHRIRAGTDTAIVSATAASESAGVISASVNFGDGNWQAGDLGYIEFSGITATVVDVTSELPVVRKDFRVESAASQSSVDTLDGLHDVPAADADTNTNLRDVVGNKEDAAVGTADAVSSLMAYIKAILAGVGGRLVYGSAVQATVVLPAVAANQSLPSVTVDNLPANLTINRVIAAVAWRKQVDSSGSANAVDGNQQVQVRSDAPGTFRNAITISDNSLSTDASTTEGGIMLLGDSDISVEVTGEDTYEFQWTSALVDGASLTLHDVQTYIIIEYS